MKNLKLTQKKTKDATEKKVWTLVDYITVSDLQTHVTQRDKEFAITCFWTGFKLVTRKPDGFVEALKKLDIKYLVSTEKVVKSKESDTEVLARVLNIDASSISQEVLEKLKSLM